MRVVPFISITAYPRVEDGEDGWYAVVGDTRVGPCASEDDASATLNVLMARAGWLRA